MHITQALELIAEWHRDDATTPFTDRQMIQIADYFLRRLPKDHDMPGGVYLQFLGEMDWFREHGRLTLRQHRWLLHNIRRYQDQARW